METLDGAASLRTASGATEEVATAKDKKKAEDTFDPLSITNDDDIFVLILFIEEGAPERMFRKRRRKVAALFP